MRLQEAIKLARKEREELLQRQTAGHPAVLVVESKLRELQAALDNTPRTLEPLDEQPSVGDRARDSAWAATESEAGTVDDRSNASGLADAVADGDHAARLEFDESAAREEIARSPWHRQLTRNLEDIDKALELARAAA